MNITFQETASATVGRKRGNRRGTEIDRLAAAGLTCWIAVLAVEMGSPVTRLLSKGQLLRPPWMMEEDWELIRPVLTVWSCTVPAAVRSISALFDRIMAPLVHDW
ncbi:hypothetical protein VTI28DRAFT_4688 [Corynascus sepedonium]